MTKSQCGELTRDTPNLAIDTLNLPFEFWPKWVTDLPKFSLIQNRIGENISDGLNFATCEQTLTRVQGMGNTYLNALPFS